MAKAETAKSQTTRLRKKVRRTVVSGVGHIKASFNNTIVTISTPQGEVISWQTSGGSGFRGARKSTPYAAQVAAKTAATKAREYGLKTLEKVLVKGPGPGRESAVRALAEFFDIKVISDVTSLPHNGVRPEKERRV